MPECGLAITFEVQSLPGGGHLSDAAREAMRQAFSCDLPAGHGDDHQAHDADGNLLAWWES